MFSVATTVLKVLAWVILVLGAVTAFFAILAAISDGGTVTPLGTIATPNPWLITLSAFAPLLGGAVAWAFLMVVAMTAEHVRDMHAALIDQVYGDEEYEEGYEEGYDEEYSE